MNRTPIAFYGCIGDAAGRPQDMLDGNAASPTLFAPWMEQRLLGMMAEGDTRHMLHMLHGCAAGAQDGICAWSMMQAHHRAWLRARRILDLAGGRPCRLGYYNGGFLNDRAANGEPNRAMLAGIPTAPIYFPDPGIESHVLLLEREVRPLFDCGVTDYGFDATGELHRTDPRLLAWFTNWGQKLRPGFNLVREAYPTIPAAGQPGGVLAIEKTPGEFLALWTFIRRFDVLRDWRNPDPQRMVLHAVFDLEAPEQEVRRLHNGGFVLGLAQSWYVGEDFRAMVRKVRTIPRGRA